MDLSDLRRLSATAVAVAFVLLLWMIFIGLHDAALFEWTLPERGLSWFGFTAWLWTGIGLLVVIVAVIGLLAFGVNQAPPGFAKGKLRQVQCQDCKAVFFVHDAGNRPLTHMCPSCKALGVYDGKTPPVGKPPKPMPPPRVVKLTLNCHACENRFDITDSGARPLTVQCPECSAVGAIQ